MRKTKGVIRVDWFREYGLVFPILLYKKDGNFLIQVSPEISFIGKNLEDVRCKTKKHLDDMYQVTFKPVIVVHYDNGFRSTIQPSDDKLDFKYTRLFVGKNANGETIWRVFDPVGNIPDDVPDTDWRDVLEGKPGPETREMLVKKGADDQVEVIEYAHDTWMALRRISNAMRELNRRLETIMKEGSIAQLLSSIAIRPPGSLFALPAPAKKERSILLKSK